MQRLHRHLRELSVISVLFVIVENRRLLHDNNAEAGVNIVASIGFVQSSSTAAGYFDEIYILHMLKSL